MRQAEGEASKQRASEACCIGYMSGKGNCTLWDEQKFLNKNPVSLDTIIILLQSPSPLLLKHVSSVCVFLWESGPLTRSTPATNPAVPLCSKSWQLNSSYSKSVLIHFSVLLLHISAAALPPPGFQSGLSWQLDTSATLWFCCVAESFPTCWQICMHVQIEPP